MRLSKIVSNKTAQKVITLSICFLIFMCLSKAELYGLKPFGTAFYIATCFMGLGVIYLTPMYLLSMLLSGGVSYLLMAMVYCAYIIPLYALFGSLKIKQKKMLIHLCCALSFMPVLIFMSVLEYNVVLVVVSTLCVEVFCLAGYTAFMPVIREKLQYKMLETELIALGLVIVFISLGVSSYTVFGVPMVSILLGFCVCISAYNIGVSKAVIVSLLVGTGQAIHLQQIDYIAVFSLSAVVGAMFVSAPKIIMPLGTVLGYTIASFMFYQEYSTVINFIVGLCIGGAVYVVIPKKVLKTIKEYMFVSHERTAVRYLINKNRFDTGIKLGESSNIFRAMGEYIVSPPEEQIDYSDSLKNKCCSICESYSTCTSPTHTKALNELTEIVLANSSVGVNEIPKHLFDNCSSLARLMQTSNEISGARAKARAKSESDSSARRIVAESMQGVSKVLRSLSKTCSSPLLSDTGSEKVLIEELNYLGVVTSQSIVTQDDVCLIIRSETFDKKVIEKAVTKIMKSSYRVGGVDDTMLAGFSAISLKKVPKYDVVFGVASAPKLKGQKSGDTHSFIKLDNNRLMLALCDGMGSGEKAEKVSDSAIGLVESFYKAGFDHDLVLKSVNRYLTLNTGESYSTLDICVIDLSRAKADIIKLGSPPCYVKKGSVVSRIDSSSVPIGVMETVEPTIYSVDLKMGDMLTLVTDGVSESFEGDRLSSTINNIKCLSPQVVAESLLEHTIYNNAGQVKDDSTVIVARLVAV